eukprot:NODE_191_length_13422_cov_1.451025.p10 type:complete len:108 gc:universal NODE_191_length_13422_cov_1.451025:6280-6603(+)
MNISFSGSEILPPPPLIKIVLPFSKNSKEQTLSILRAFNITCVSSECKRFWILIEPCPSAATSKTLFDKDFEPGTSSSNSFVLLQNGYIRIPLHKCNSRTFFSTIEA